MIEYFLGLRQFPPKWLPRFFRPTATGEYWKWFGMKVSEKDAVSGESLFMFWRRKLGEYLVRTAK